MTSGEDKLQIDTVYNKTYHGRRLIVKYHLLDESPAELGFDPKFNFIEWYCGYMQILPSDAEWQDAAGTNAFNTTKFYDDFPNDFPSAIGGITFTGKMSDLDEKEDDGRRYVGFDTNHYNTKPDSVEKCVASLKKMTSELSHENK